MARRRRRGSKKNSGLGAIIGIGIVLWLIGSVFGGRSTSDTSPERPVTPSSFQQTSTTTLADEQVNVTITSDPTGAIVTLGGREIGTTPISVSVPKNQSVSYSLKVPSSMPYHDLYHPFNDTLIVTKDEAVSVWIERFSEEETAALQAKKDAEARAKAEAEAAVQAVQLAPSPTTSNASARATSNFRLDPNGPDRDCGEFYSYSEAYDFFVAAGGPNYDRHRLDRDNDGIPCETLR